MKNPLALTLGLLLLPMLIRADIFDQLLQAIKTGDSKQVAAYFNKTVDFSTPLEVDIYSKAQAEMLLKDFFLKYPPKSFSIHHRGSSAQGAKYVIGKYEYDKGSLRVYVLVKEQDGKQLIQELHFEKE